MVAITMQTERQMQAFSLSDTHIYCDLKLQDAGCCTHTPQQPRRQRQQLPVAHCVVQLGT